MSVLREGRCACGSVRYRLTSDPLFTHCCHCLNCQRQTGSAFVINLLIEADRVELLAGDPQPVDVPRDDGSTQRIYRCSTCQVAVFSEYTRPEVASSVPARSTIPRRYARRAYLHAVESRLDRAPGLRTGVRRLLRPQGALAGRESRAAEGDHAIGELRRLTRRRCHCVVNRHQRDASRSGQAPARGPEPACGQSNELSNAAAGVAGVRSQCPVRARGFDPEAGRIEGRRTQSTAVPVEKQKSFPVCRVPQTGRSWSS